MMAGIGGTLSSATVGWGDGTFLDRLAPGRADALVGAGHRRRLARGDVLFVEGDLADRVAVVLAGRLKVATISSSGTDALLDMCGPGELIGEVSAFDGSPRTATVTAMERSEVAILSVRAFEQFLADHGDIAVALVRQLCQRMRTSNDTRTRFGSDAVPTRLAGRLVSLFDEHGITEPDGTRRIGIALTQVELAAWIGASREAVAKALQQLRQQDIVTTARRSITILDLDRLRDRAR